MKTFDKRKKIIRAATKVFAKKGFFNARISDIAKDAKIADGTIYLYFNNKVDLLFSVFEDEIGAMIVQTNEILDSEPDPGKKLEMFAVKHLTTMKKNKNLSQVLHIELRQANRLAKGNRSTRAKEYVDIVSDIICLGQQQSIFRASIIPGIAKRAFFGALEEVSRVWDGSLETNYSVEETTSQIMSIFLTGMIDKKMN